MPLAPGTSEPLKLRACAEHGALPAQVPHYRKVVFSEAGQQERRLQGRDTCVGGGGHPVMFLVT